MGEFPNRHPQKYLILNRLARDPDMTAAEASRMFNVNRHTIGIWCREAGIPLNNHKKPRVGFVLSRKRASIKRLLKLLAALEREVRALEQLDPSAPYTKPKKAKK